MSYLKTATWLHTLTGIVGEETMNEIFREYYRKWAFKHPSGKDFINVVNEVVKREHGEDFGPDMNWFFDQTLYGTGICDYRVSGIQNMKHRRSFSNTGSGDTSKVESTDTYPLFTSIAQLERTGDLIFPVDVLIGFSDGREILEKWDGKERFKDYEYTGKREIEWVKIDPEFRIRMDVNYINNSLTTGVKKATLHRLAAKMLSFVQFWLSFML
jgi:aminopeptidase N